MTDVEEPRNGLQKLKVNGENGHSYDKQNDHCQENIPRMSDAELVEAMEDAKAMFSLVMANNVTEAKVLGQKRADRSMYHSLAQTAIALAHAYISFTPELIEEAMECSRRTVRLCYLRRKRTTLTDNTFTKANKRRFYDELTEEEVHAELVYAECQALRAFSTLIRDDKMLTFIKAGMRFKLSYHSFKECQEILAYRTTWNNEYLKKEFECGVAFGIGTYNLVLSAFPKRFQVLFEFIGFSAKKDIGDGKLEEAQKMHGCLMQLIGCLTIMAYHCMFCAFMSRGCGSLDYVEMISKQCLAAYPNSAIFYGFAGRIENLKGNSEKAIQWFQKTVEIEFEWKNIFHLAYWELAWCHVYLAEFRKAIPLIDKLCKESNWSKVIFHYTKACLLLMCKDITEEEKIEVAKLLKESTQCVARYAGKAVPVEKEICKKCDLYFAQDSWLLLPIYEFMYTLNICAHMEPFLLNTVLAEAEKAMESLKGRQDWKYYYENYYLALFLKGVSLSHLGKTSQAEECFKDVIKNQKKMKDSHLPACANLEMAFIYMDAQKLSIAKNYLKDAKKHKALFLVEFRIRLAREELKTGKKR